MAQMAAGGLILGGSIAEFQGIGEQANSERRQLRELEELRRQEALELLDRSEINIQTLRAEGELFKGKQKLDFASRGIDIGSGSALSVIEESNSQVLRQILLERRQTAFQVEQKNKEAASAREKFGEVGRVQRLRQAGTILKASSSFLSGVS